MKRNLDGFSLIEIVIATSIITITVFGIYKLIGENTKIINNSSNYLQVNSLFPIIEECIDNLGISAFNGSVNEEYIFNFGDTGSLDLCNIATGDPVIIDNIEYIIKSKIIGKIDGEVIEWKLSITSDNTKTMTGYYKQIK